MSQARQRFLGTKLNASNLVPRALRKVAQPRETSDYIAYIDEIGPGTVRGWAAYRPDGLRRVSVRIYLDNQLVAEGSAQEAREDVQRAGFGDGAHGYMLPIPKKALLCAEAISLAVVTEEGEVICARRILRDADDGTPRAIYIDASDLVEYLTHHRELSGIQRVQAGYLLGLGKDTVGSKRVQICTRLKYSSFYFNIAYENFARLLHAAGDPSAVSSSGWAAFVQKFKDGLVSRANFREGDLLFTLGAPWALDDHNETIRCAKLHDGARYIQIFYDLIPISVPEVVAAPLIPHFARAMAAMSIYADHIFSISRYSMTDLSETLASLVRDVPSISVIPMGGTITGSEAQTTRKPDTLARLGVEGPFVLCVGTLEPRKNHMLLYRVWRRLVATHGASNVPKLVLVGRVGWYMDDFLRILKVTDRLDKTIVHLTGVSNDELSELYDSCLFTIFPSLSEGWGLPITESLARGKVCVCSNVTSMPEAGGDYALYIDPLDATECFDLCEKLLYDGHTLRRHEIQLRESFTAPTWDEASQALKKQLVELATRLDARTAKPLRKKVDLGRTYKFFNIEASQVDARSLEVFRNFLDQEDALDLLSGWAWFDLDVHCTWSCGSEASLSFAFGPEAPADLIVYLGLIVPPCLDDVPFLVLDGHKDLGLFRAPSGKSMIVVNFDGTSPEVRSPDGRAERKLVLRLEGARKPAEDKRLLGLGIVTVTVFDRDDLVGRLTFCEREVALDAIPHVDLSPRAP